MRSALGVRFLALLVAAAALLPACKKEGDTIILSPAAPNLPQLPEGAFVAGNDGIVYFVTPEGFVRTFHDFGSGNEIWGLAWDRRAKVLYSAVWGSIGQGVIYRHKLDGGLTVYASKIPGTDSALRAGPLAISPTDGKLYSGTNDGFIIRWDGPENGTKIHDAKDGTIMVIFITGLAFNSSGEVFYSTDQPGIGPDEVRRMTGETTYETWLPFSGANLRGLSFDPSGTLFVTATAVDKIIRIDGPGVYSDYLTGLSGPHDIAIDEAGNHWLALQFGVRVLDPNRQPVLPDPLATSAGRFHCIDLCDIKPFPPAPPEVKEIFVGNMGGQILSVTPDGSNVSLFYSFINPVGGVTWHAGENRLYSASRGIIYSHAIDGTPTPFASTVPGGSNPLGTWCLAVSPVDGKLYCGTNGGLIIRWDGPNNGTVVHDGSTPIWGLTITQGGDIFYSTGGWGQVRKVTSSTEYETWLSLSGAVHVVGLAHDDVGRIYVTEQTTDKVFRLFSPSVNEVFLTSSWVPNPLGIAVDAQGNVWVSGSDGALKAFDPTGVPLVPYPIAGSLGYFLSIALRH